MKAKYGVVAFTILVVISQLLFADSIILGPSDFFPEDSRMEYLIQDNAEYLQTNDSYFKNFYASVQLPQDAKVTSISLFYMDISDRNITLNFYKRNRYTNQLQSLCSYTTEVNVPERRIQKISPVLGGKIDNTGYSYFISLDLAQPGAGRIYAVKIIYTIP